MSQKNQNNSPYIGNMQILLCKKKLKLWPATDKVTCIVFRHPPGFPQTHQIWPLQPWLNWRSKFPNSSQRRQQIFSCTSSHTMDYYLCYLYSAYCLNLCCCYNNVSAVCPPAFFRFLSIQVSLRTFRLNPLINLWVQIVPILLSMFVDILSGSF